MKRVKYVPADEIKLALRQASTINAIVYSIPPDDTKLEDNTDWSRIEERNTGAQIKIELKGEIPADDIKLEDNTTGAQIEIAPVTTVPKRYHVTLSLMLK